MQSNRQYILTLLVVTMMFSITVFAKENYQENIHYERIEPEIATKNKNKKEVIELFWYGCPHCNALEPYVTRWLKNKPEHVEFKRVPAIFRPNWEVYARAFYTAESFGILDRFHTTLFEAIHGEKRKINTEKSFTRFFADLGIDEKKFIKVFRSTDVEKKIKKARSLTLEYGIRGVPALIVNGKFRTGARLVRKKSELFKVVNYLINTVK